MKKYFFLVLLLAAISAHAKFIQATVVFNNGHIENGFVKSFLEDNFIDFGTFQKLESRLNMNDADLKFKSSEKGEIRTISIDDVDELTLIYKDDVKQLYKVLYLQEFTSGGAMKPSKYKMWFPLVKKGKVNVYGYRYRETDPNYATGGFSTSTEYIYYFQNDKKNYAMSPLAEVTLGNAMSGGAQKLMENCFNDLFSDCPEFAVKAIKSSSASPKIMSYKEYKKGMKDRKKAAESQNYNAIRQYFETYYYQISDAFVTYEKECPN